MTIKHEKIAARVRYLTPSFSSVYRLSKPVEYTPFDPTAAPDVTWYVRTTPLNAWPSSEGGWCVGHSLFKNFEFRREAEALDALGYELIEEEK